MQIQHKDWQVLTGREGLKPCTLCNEKIHSIPSLGVGIDARHLLASDNLGKLVMRRPRPAMGHDHR